MNENTLVACCGYAGDARQVQFLMPYFLHHKCPVVVLSPTDSPIKVTGPNITCKTGGKRAYIGQDSLDRQIEHLKILLTFPQQFFLVNDADSVALSPKLPAYLYREPDVLWSNEVSDAMHVRPASYTLPQLAFQPPYFMSRSVIQKLLAIAPQIKAEPQTPFIDWAMMAWAIHGNIPHKSFPDGGSCGTQHPEGFKVMSDLVRLHGRIFIHSVKSRDTLIRFVHDRIHYKKRHP